MYKIRILEEANLPLEVAILLIAALAMLITGILLFPVSIGVIPYYENGLYGLLLFIFAIQIVTIGKTPFWDMSRSMPLIIIGTIIASVGIVTCFIPVFLSQIPGIMLFIFFTPGGFFLLFRTLLSREKLRSWLKYKGIFNHLIFSSIAVYFLSILIGLLVLMHNLLNITMTAVVALLFGILLIYLSFVLWKIYIIYPEAENVNKGTVNLSADKMLLLLTGVFMLILGVLLIPVSLGELPFSGSAQLGLLMIIFAIQIMSSGSTPIGLFPKSWLIIIIGLFFAVLGIISNIVPDILVMPLTILIGVLNIAGGIITLTNTFLPLLKKTQNYIGSVPLILKKLFFTQIIMGCLSILFGLSMLISYLIPGLVVGVVLFANGCVLLYLIKILLVIDKMRNQNETIKNTL
ncbi:hypothetical protein [Thermodesulfobium sp.]